MWKVWARMFGISLIFFGLFGCTNHTPDDKKVLADLQEEKGAPRQDETVNVKADEETIETETRDDEPIKEETAKTAQANSSQTIENEDEIKITWDDFFDEDRQTEPSKKFWQLKGETVELKGWMGEVLSLSQGWFLLIPAPGADCPFCSEDESYWNEIMIVFVEDKKELRHTNEPLLVRGRLDVGIKIDESNYKTMFRLYDATFETL